jgi:hypothetical protein
VEGIGGVVGGLRFELSGARESKDTWPRHIVMA